MFELGYNTSSLSMSSASMMVPSMWLNFSHVSCFSITKAIVCKMFFFSRHYSKDYLFCVHLCVSPLNSFPKSIILCVVPECFLRDSLVENSLQSNGYLLLQNGLWPQEF